MTVRQYLETLDEETLIKILEQELINSLIRGNKLSSWVHTEWGSFRPGPIKLLDERMFLHYPGTYDTRSPALSKIKEYQGSQEYKWSGQWGKKRLTALTVKASETGINNLWRDFVESQLLHYERVYSTHDNDIASLTLSKDTVDLKSPKCVLILWNKILIVNYSPLHRKPFKPKSTKSSTLTTRINKVLKKQSTVSSDI